MQKKRAIRYLRISTDRQSHFSIEGQDMHTQSWCERNNVEIADTFIDEGYSARNFDRPDFQRLTKFIAQHYRTVDYLVVNAFDRFSRSAGEAIVEIKNLQKKFAIKVVSVTEGVTFDAEDPGSFFYAGLMLLKGEDEIIRNRNRINLGIYTAKKKQGRYLGAAPIGYKNSRDEKNVPIILIDEDKAPWIRFIFKSFLSGVPLKQILTDVKEKGFSHTSHEAVQRILKNPVYTGLLTVKAYKEYPAEIVEGIHKPIIDRSDWNDVQRMMRKGKQQTIINDKFPLRSILLCHCGKPLTGAPSRSRNGNYYNYYKCNVSSAHNNFSAEKANNQLTEAFSYMSLPGHMIIAIKNKSEQLLEEKMKASAQFLSARTEDLIKVETKLHSIEDKWISNQMAFDTYQRWFTDLTAERMALRADIDKLSRSQGETWLLLQDELDKLKDLSSLYTASTTIQKQQFVRLVFDRKLYYKEGIYRTTYLMEIFKRNLMILKEKKLLEFDEKRENQMTFPSGGAERLVIEPLSDFLHFIQQIKVA